MVGVPHLAGTPAAQEKLLEIDRVALLMTDHPLGLNRRRHTAVVRYHWGYDKDDKDADNLADGGGHGAVGARTPGL